MSKEEGMYPANSNPPPYSNLSSERPPCQPPPYTPPSQPFEQYQPYPQMQPAQQPYPTNVTVFAPNAFDSGARFDMSRPVIPPPPPGVAPNAAQLAAMQGHNVVVTQRKPNFWFGSEDF